MAEDPPANRRQFTNPMFREVHKNTWLRKIGKGNADSKKAKKEHVWVVFCVHDDSDAYLEAYFDNKSAALHKPLWYASLNNTQHVSPTICAQDHEYEFVITLSSEVLRLAAPTWDVMFDWVESLRAKLEELKILMPKENVYSKPPEGRTTPLLPTRDPTSPLPLPPEGPPAFLPGIEPMSSNSSNHNHLISRELLHRTTNSESSSVGSRDSGVIEANENQVQSAPHVFNFHNLSAELLAEIHTQPAIDSVNESSFYEHLFQMPEVPGPSNLNLECLAAQRQNQLSVNTSLEPRLTLREYQVLQLQKEIAHPGGVRIPVRKKDCTNCIAFVEAFNSIWIAGWKLKENPMLYNVLHIGDKLLALEGFPVQSANDMQTILRSCTTFHVHLLVNRVPHGQVFVIRRDIDGQPLGIVQDGNTAVIADVLKDGLASRHGLTARTPSLEGTSLTNWVLTEINGRPLNLFYKDNQVKDRLNAVGRDISILVQPLDLVKCIKKQMKSMKNYKDYLLQ